MKKKNKLMYDILTPTGLKKSKTKDAYNAHWDEAKKKGSVLNLVTVQVRRSSALLGQTLSMRVLVQSQRMQGRGKHGEMEIYRSESLSGMRDKACILAGALAEACCNDYGDYFDPSDVSRAAGDAFDKMVKKLERGELEAGSVQA